MGQDTEAIRVPELLAPAGTLDALLAAVAAGADAVYAGLGALNARAALAGFTLEDLARGCAVAHARGARVYVTLNVVVYDAELVYALELAGALDTSVDYLMGWTENNVNVGSVGTNNGVIGQNSGNIHLEQERSKEEAELLRIFNGLDVKRRMELLMTAIRLEEESK